ncbi:hypothetical protein [Paenibacillus donghaensis]|uniref:PepSY domain-containing protein n=1 Tax=Paenibacillus donghaensis TaxID=414771 RepID=A0A2Z2KG93_9BACL|nr:hypothetical protein [Paenibacillus donghaensis]ASA21169.1 hypothetical protein B9T62_10445 [Paenibacillus donghaensis]
MKSKRITAAITVFAISGGLLTLSALSVPGLVKQQAVAAERIPAVQEQSITKVKLDSGNIPVLKVEAATPVSTVEEYLKEQMTPAEIKKITDYFNIRNSGLDMSRDMSEAEVKRRDILDENYQYDGLRPASSIPLQKGNNEFYIDMQQGSFMLPARALTDEELLQFVDWNWRENFALSQQWKPQQPDTKDISKTAALSAAKASVARIFDADVSKLETKASFNRFGPAQKGNWWISYRPYKMKTLLANGVSFLSYNVIVDSLTGTVVDTTVVNYDAVRTPISAAASKKISKDKSWIEAARRIVTEKQGETRKISSASLVKSAEDEKRGMVNVKITLEDGSTYTAEMRYPDQTLRCLIYKEAAPAK